MPRTIREIRIEGNVAFIPLTKGYTAVIDVEDVPLIAGSNWSARVPSNRNTVYAARRNPRAVGGHIVSLHRFLMGSPAGFEVDHIDGDGLNNRRSNLRCATRSQNQHNRRPNKGSGPKGVAWHKRDQKWQARIMLNGKHHWLGNFSTAEEASLAYAEASQRLHGDFGHF